VRGGVKKGEAELDEMGYGSVDLSDAKADTLTKLMAASRPLKR
jgi:hypothetical protein